MTNQDSSTPQRRIIISIYALPLRQKPKKNWRPVFFAWVISVVIQVAAWLLGLTDEVSLVMAVVNGSLIWFALSLLLFIAQPICFIIFGVLMKLDADKSVTAAIVVDALIVLLSGFVVVQILHLTHTPTLAAWWWYAILGILHCIRAGQLRSKIS